MIENAIKRGFRRIACGFWRFDGVLLSGLHPSKISVSDGEIGFTYGNAARSFTLERSSDKKITAFTNPDGTRTEVVRQ